LSIGLIALLDDVAGIAKVAAASLDDVVTQAAKAGAKAAPIVVDDIAVTPQYVVGFAARRELPIVARIAAGSLRNKLLVLLPVTLALSYFLPGMITPLLVLGGVYLCFEGTEKIFEAIVPPRAHLLEARLSTMTSSQRTEDQKIAGAIKTDFILSAEIMAITLAAVSDQGIFTLALVLAIVAIAITAAVYGLVALIVKADDAGVALARIDSGTFGGRIGRTLGRGLVLGMPGFMRCLSAVGTAAMIWVGGGIIVHGLETFGLHAVGGAIGSAAEAAAHALPSAGGIARWAVAAFLSGLLGLLVGAVAIPIVGFFAARAGKRLRGRENGGN
jgi:predicted DNA repair protein MutK